MDSIMIFHCKSCEKKYEKEIGESIYYATIEYYRSGASLDKLVTSLHCAKCNAINSYNAEEIYDGIIEYKANKLKKSFIKEY